MVMGAALSSQTAQRYEPPSLTEMMPRMSSLTLTAAAAASSQATAAGGGNDIFHVAIFRFPKEHIEDAMTAFRQLAAASRRDPGNLGYNIYRGTDDDQEFTEAFIHLGQGVLVRYATLHDTVTAHAFDVG